MISEPLPAAISQLKLRYAFRGYNPPVLECIDSTVDSQIMVVDDEELFYSHFTTDSQQEYRCILVNNTQGHEIYLLAIDNRLISNYKGGIADCALFDEQLFNFVEFKTNAEGNSPAQVELTYRNAISQLVNTYNLFTEKLSAVGVDFERIVDVQMYVVVSNLFPRENAIEQSLRLEYAADFSLNFENTLSFVK